MKSLLMVGLGSFVGGILRYSVSLIPFLKTQTYLAWPTLLVNIIGSFLIGYWFNIFSNAQHAESWRLFAVTGLLGGFTTFSAFSMEAVLLIRAGNQVGAIIYIAITIVFCLLSCFLGMTLFSR